MLKFSLSLGFIRFSYFALVMYTHRLYDPNSGALSMTVSPQREIRHQAFL